MPEDGGFHAHFGGPDRPRGSLRDVLATRVAAVPGGGEIDWITYYFRDRRLAEALLCARHRGVRVRVTMEGHPRTAPANDRVVAMLAGLGGDLRIVSHRPLPVMRRRPVLHEKIYCFSHPRPAAFVGSFNPSGDEPEEEPEIIDEILDQDRGHNLLVEITDRALVTGLVAHARRLHASRHGWCERLAPALNRSLRGACTTIHFWPRVRSNPVLRLLRGCGHGACVRVAASHFKGRGMTRDLEALVRRGARVEVVAESTARRAPAAVERRLVAAGIRVTRLAHAEKLPMHNKFILVEDGAARYTVFGSCNWTGRSRWLNHEVAVITADPRLFESFAARWEEMLSMADERISGRAAR